MTTQEAIDYYKGVKRLARALDVYPQSVYQWLEAGSPPLGRQYELEVKTEGKLKADREAD